MTRGFCGTCAGALLVFLAPMANGECPPEVQEGVAPPLVFQILDSEMRVIAAYDCQTDNALRLPMVEAGPDRTIYLRYVGAWWDNAEWMVNNLIFTTCEDVQSIPCATAGYAGLAAWSGPQEIGPQVVFAWWQEGYTPAYAHYELGWRYAEESSWNFVGCSNFLAPPQCPPILVEWIEGPIPARSLGWSALKARY